MTIKTTTQQYPVHPTQNISKFKAKQEFSSVLFRGVLKKSQVCQGKSKSLQCYCFLTSWPQ